MTGSHEIGWIDLPGVVNMRDVGGIPTLEGGRIARGRLIRSDNLQDLPPASVERIVDELGVTDVVDLRSFAELAHEGDGPLIGDPRVRIHHFTLYAHDADEPGVPAGERVLPWVAQQRAAAAGQDVPGDPGIARAATDADHDRHWSDHYLGYLAQRPESVIAALRVIAHAPGAVIVHCAAGKDRTGTVTGLALLAVGADPEAVMADFAASGERVEQILARLRSRPTYAANLAGQTAAQQRTQGGTMQRLVSALEASHGGVTGWLAAHGWTSQDTDALRARLVG